jgi:hypothetical protein
MPDDFDLRLLGMVLGTLMSALVLGYLVLSEVKPRHQENFSGVLTFVGGYNLALGLYLGGGWIALVGQRLAQRSTLTPGAPPGPLTPEILIHAGLELGAALALINAGLALLRNRPNPAKKLYSAIGLLFFAQAAGMALYGFRGHSAAAGSGVLSFALIDTPMVWALLMLSGITGFFYGWEHYVLKLDKRAHRLPIPNLPEDVDRNTREQAEAAASRGKAA